MRPVLHGVGIIWMAITIVAGRAADKPNIILFLADDLGWTGLRCFGSDLYETPHLDRLAQEGMKFTDAYAACTVCSPSRAALMTGKYPARLHLTDFIAGQNRPFAKLQIPQWTKGLRHDEITIAEVLKAGGYRTAHVGKWHLEHKPARAGIDDWPTGHGFDRSVVKPSSKGYFLTKAHKGFETGDYVTDYLAKQAADIVDEWKEDPFFLYFAFHVPHTPIQGKEELIEAYKRKVNPNNKHTNPIYAAMVHSMDEAVGRVLKQVEASGIADRTTILFTSDNGGLTQRYGKPDGFTDNHPLRRGKGSAYEGGVRVPMIVKWPEVTPAGSLCAVPVMGIDFYPTILEIAGLKGDATHNANLDGISVVSLLKDPQAPWKRDSLYWHYPHYHAGGDGPYGAVRMGKWRYMQFYENGAEELYHLQDDIGETRNVAAAHAAVRDELRARFDAWRESVGAQMPTPNPRHDPTRATQVARGRR